jgi:NADPH:quinone reductase-like Zn-dependent oxidoreductase
MRAFAIDEFGTPGSLQDLPALRAGANEIVVAIAVAGVNPIDWKVRDGMAGKRPLPLVLGQDFAGVVDSVGDGVTRFKRGERVFGIAREHGGYADYTALALDDHGSPVAATPAELDDVRAAAIPTAGLTALAGLVALGAENGRSVLILGATGGVGAFATQLARVRGARIVATASEKNHDFALSLGAGDVADYDREDVVETVKAWYPEGVDGILDLVSKDADSVAKMAPLLAPGGKLVSTNHAADEAWFSERGFHALNISLATTPQSSPEGLTELADMVTAGTIQVFVEQHAPLADAAAILEQSKTGKVGGKAVLTVTA